MAGAPSTSDILPPPDVIFGKSAAMQGIRLQLEKIAAANLPVLIQGESGTGKDILARLIHKLSPRASGPFVKINCPAIPATLMESELFGYERGAFTGANTSKPGRVEIAHKGTLFLDEISELDLALQSKLLQLLQDGQFCRIGAHEDKKVEVRVVCATNRQLDEEIELGSFRSDLFYRINVLNLQVCPLRERAEDIPILVEYFVSIYNEKYNLRAPQPGPDLIRKLQGYGWPGNIRELENTIERAIVFGSSDYVLPEDLNEDLFEKDFPIEVDTPHYHEAVKQAKQRIVRTALERADGSVTDAAKELGMRPNNLHRLIRNLGVRSPEFTNFKE